VAANDYHFITTLRIPATPEEITEVLGDAPALARWWPSVYLTVSHLAPGDDLGVGRLSIVTPVEAAGSDLPAQPAPLSPTLTATVPSITERAKPTERARPMRRASRTSRAGPIRAAPRMHPGPEGP